mmetsp:Transcript_45433/g.66649  ORF Transcript_45433/g.66649 Transcript_45433/m.66649 type:complete len:243 (+) Transcript_45433:853-1581(+)
MARKASFNRPYLACSALRTGPNASFSTDFANLLRSRSTCSCPSCVCPSSFAVCNRCSGSEMGGSRSTLLMASSSMCALDRVSAESARIVSERCVAPRMLTAAMTASTRWCLNARSCKCWSCTTSSLYCTPGSNEPMRLPLPGETATSDCSTACRHASSESGSPMLLSMRVAVNSLTIPLEWTSASSKWPNTLLHNSGSGCKLAGLQLLELSVREKIDVDGDSEPAASRSNPTAGAPPGDAGI